MKIWDPHPKRRYTCYHEITDHDVLALQCITLLILCCCEVTFTNCPPVPCVNQPMVKKSFLNSEWLEPTKFYFTNFSLFFVKKKVQHLKYLIPKDRHLSFIIFVYSFGELCVFQFFLVASTQ